MDQLQLQIAQLDKILAKIPLAVKIEQKTAIPKAYAAIGAGAVFVVLVVFNIFAPFLTALLGFIYPAYASFKAIESKDTKDDTLWLTYWVTFSFFHILEFFSDILLYWIPFYYLLKCLAILWLSLPAFRGAEIVYQKLVRPFLFQHTNAVDAGISKLKSKAEELASKLE